MLKTKHNSAYRALKVKVGRDNIYRAVQNQKWEIIEKFIKNGGDLSASVIETGPQAGYTPLHLAVMEGKQEIVCKLIRKYKVNVDSVGADSARPLHLAVLRRDLKAAKILLEFGANIDTEFTKEVIKKYAAKNTLLDYFDCKMTLLTFAISSNVELRKFLLNHNASVVTKDCNNKTLLMYAFENNFHHIARQLIKLMKNTSEINARDDDGFHAVHYLLPNRKFGRFRYVESEFLNMSLNVYGEDLIKAGANINAMVNGDPDTLLINKVAFRCCLNGLQMLLNLDVPVSVEARPLCYFMSPINSDKYYHTSSEDPVRKLQYIKDLCSRIIVENLVLRRALGMFIPHEEIELMDQLVFEDPKINKIVSDFQNDFINKVLKKLEISYGGKTITVFDLAVKVFNGRSLKLLVKDDKLVEAAQKFCSLGYFGRYNLPKAMKNEVMRACERKKLMERVEKISQLRKFIPLPYEIILMIIEYFDNKDLEIFVHAFDQNYICL